MSELCRDQSMTDHVPLCLFSQHCQSIGIIVVLKKEAVGIQTLFTWFCMLDQNQFYQDLQHQWLKCSSKSQKSLHRAREMALVACRKIRLKTSSLLHCLFLFIPWNRRLFHVSMIHRSGLSSLKNKQKSISLKLDQAKGRDWKWVKSSQCPSGSRRTLAQEHLKKKTKSGSLEGNKREMTFAHRCMQLIEVWLSNIGLSPIILTELQFCRRTPNVALLNVPFCLQVFHANADATEVVLNRIPQPVLARFVRIKPQTWKNGIALRFELYGCQITGKTDGAFFSCGVSQTFSGQGSTSSWDSSENTEVSLSSAGICGRFFFICII